MDAVKWKNDHIEVLDGTLLPDKECYHDYNNYREVGAAIEEQIIAGTGSSVIAIAMSVALTVDQQSKQPFDKLKELLQFMIDYFKRITPETVLFRILYESLDEVVANGTTIQDLVKGCRETSLHFSNMQKGAAQKIVEQAKGIVQNGDNILLFSANGSGLASFGGGVISSVLNNAQKRGLGFELHCAETRPSLSGSRIMAWELMKNGHNVSLFSDIHMAKIMEQGMVNAVYLTGEALYRNGVLESRCGTSIVIEMAKKYSIPMYLFLPSYQLDGGEMSVNKESLGASITEVALVKNNIVVPEGVRIHNFVNDYSDISCFSKIITDKQVLDPVCHETIAELF